MNNLFNSYERVARVYPAIIVSIPIMVAYYIISIISDFSIIMSISSSGIILIAIVFLLSNIVRYYGKKIEPGMWKSWGGSPSIRYLRKSDAKYAEETKQILYDKIKQISGIDLAVNQADVKIEQAFVSLRNAARKRYKNGLWETHNQEYGFIRNLLGVKWLCLILSFICSLGCFIAILYSPANSKYLIAGGVINIIYFLFALYCGWVILPDLIKSISDRYAEDILMSFLN